MAEKAKQNNHSSFVVSGLGLSLAELIVLRNIKKRVSCIYILFIYKAFIEIGAGLNGTDMPPFAKEYLKTKRTYKSCNRRSSSLGCTTLGNLSNLDILSN